MHSESRHQQRHHKREAASLIRRAAEQRHLDAGDIARLTGLPPGQARAILSGFGDTVPLRALDRTATALSD